MNGVKAPKSLAEATRMFADADVAWQFAINLRWPNGVVCPFYHGCQHTFFLTGKNLRSARPARSSSASRRSIFQDSRLTLDKLLISIWLIANAKNGISPYELHRSLEITKKSAWFVFHRVRLAIQNRGREELADEVEVMRPTSAARRGTP